MGERTTLERVDFDEDDDVVVAQVRPKSHVEAALREVLAPVTGLRRR
ncbi:MAG: hypothetical protein KY462_12250 [Actinobacteria bacterium]|nr:hypothetical protein [Actinomycetota bacterium]